MYNIIYRCMGLGPKKGKETYLGEEIETAGKLFRDIPRHEVKRYPGLSFLYRHAVNWRQTSGKSRSRTDDASALAFQCYYGYRILWDVTCRIITTDAGIALRQSIADFASTFCTPTLLIQDTGIVGNAYQWVNFDHDIALKLSERGSKLNESEPLIAIDNRLELLAWAERRSETYSSMERLVDLVSKMPAAQNGPPLPRSLPRGMPSFIAERLTALLEVRVHHRLFHLCQSASD